MSFYWYFILRFIHCAGQKLTTQDSTQSRDCKEDQQNLPVTAAQTIGCICDSKTADYLLSTELF